MSLGSPTHDWSVIAMRILMLLALVILMPTTIARGGEDCLPNDCLPDGPGYAFELVNVPCGPGNCPNIDAARANCRTNAQANGNADCEEFSSTGPGPCNCHVEINDGTVSCEAFAFFGSWLCVTTANCSGIGDCTP